MNSLRLVAMPYFKLILLAASILLLASSSTFSTASAAGAGCRTDPIVVLANGKLLRITVEVGTRARNIDSIHYTLHVPAETRVKKIIYTGGAFKQKEFLQVVHDAAPNTFAVDTVVTSNKTAQVKATTTLRQYRASVQGMTGETLSLVLTP